MEDAVTGGALLRDSVEVSFAQIESALAEAGQVSLKGRPAPALMGTVVVVGPHERLPEAAEALEHLTDTGGVRTILMSNADGLPQKIRVSHQAIALEGLKPEYVDNAVAALRLSSLPTLVWWRGGDPSQLEGLSALADRLVLDADDPVAAWKAVSHLIDETAVSDLRWTKLTVWRCLVASLFDVPEVRTAAARFTRLEIDGSDRHAARLLAGWLMSALGWRGDVRIGDTKDGPITRVRFGDDGQELVLVVRSTCLEAAARVTGYSDALRTVPLADTSLRALISDELRVRSRDFPFEAALRAAEALV
jgi:glucose-6-phosphate dehydrogenase assembly protein OpcA